MYVATTLETMLPAEFLVRLNAVFFSHLLCVCIVLGDDGDDLALFEVEGVLVPRGELGQRLHVVVLPGVGLDDVLTQKVLDLACKRKKQTSNTMSW